MVSHGVARPPWMQVYDLLRTRIESGEFPPGGRLPSIPSLAREYRVAGITVRKALAKLREENLIVTVPGWGSFVAEDPPDG